MKFTWRDRVTVMVGEMDRASALDCYKALSNLAELPDGETKTLQALTDFVIRLAVEKAPAAVVVDGVVHREGNIDITGDDFLPFTLALPLKGAALDRVPYALAEQWQMAAVAENAFLEDWLKKLVGPLATDETPNEKTPNEPASASGPSTPSAETVLTPETKTIGP